MKLTAINQTNKKRVSIGRVDVYDNGNWSIVCDRNWSVANANVTCKDLGFSGAIEPLLLPFHVKVNKTAVNYDYRCTGDEDYLIKCPRTTKRRRSCSYATHVRCIDEGKLRISCGSISSYFKMFNVV